MPFRFLLLHLAFLASLVPALAEAQFQSFPTANVEVFIARSRRMPSELLYINQQQCEGSDGHGADSVEIRIQISNLSMLGRSARILEFWLAPEGVNCHAAAGRTQDASDKSPCVMVAPALEGVSSKRQSLFFVAHDLFASPESLDGACDRRGSQTLYVVPLVNETPMQPGGRPESGSGSPIPIRFEVQVDAPGPVAGFTGGRGEVTADLSWQGALPASHEFEVYFDSTAVRLANPGPCESELLRAGEPLPSDLTGLTSRATQDSHLLVDLAEVGLLPGEKVPATVVVRDPAGNRSVASEVVCVERQFTQAVDGPSNGDDSCFDACAVRRPGEDTGAGWLWLGPALMLALRRRQARLWRFLRRRLRKSS